MSYGGNAQSHVVSEVLSLEHKDYSPNDRTAIAGDHYAHAAGQICKTCDRVIASRDPARRRGESGWVHDVCPD
jgi:hypothetical protein